jgi:hypothetical protein
MVYAYSSDHTAYIEVIAVWYPGNTVLTLEWKGETLKGLKSWRYC